MGVLDKRGIGTTLRVAGCSLGLWGSGKSRNQGGQSVSLHTSWRRLSKCWINVGWLFLRTLCSGPRPYGPNVLELTLPSFPWGLECGRCLIFFLMQTQCASLGTYTWELALTRVSPKKTCHTDPTAQTYCCSRLWGRSSKMLCLSLMMQGTHRMGLGWCRSQRGKSTYP